MSSRTELRVYRGCTFALLICACDSSSPNAATTVSWEAQERLTIGVEAGEPAYEFGRIAQVVKLSDGRIVVADGGSLGVRVFTPDGAHQRTFGRRGAGPGEFSSLTRLARLAGDTLVAGGISRLARYTPDGAYVSEERPDWSRFSRPPYFVEYAFPLPNGSFALLLLRTSADQPAETPLHRSTKMYLVTTRSVLTDSLGVFRALEQMRYRDGAEFHSALPLFPADTRAAFGAEYVAIGDMDTDSVLLYQLASRQRTWIRVPLARTPITPAALRRAQATACEWAASADDRGRCETGLRQLPRQTHYPVFRDLAVDSLGAVWLASYSADPNAVMGDWHIVDHAGRSLGTAVLPANLRLTQIGATYALGFSRDSLGVERVREFQLSRR